MIEHACGRNLCVLEWSSSNKMYGTYVVMKSRYYTGIVAIIGYLLSPLSWWNDVFVNVPLAYLFALPFSLIYEALYLPAFLLGYWLSNLLGFLLLHRAG